MYETGHELVLTCCQLYEVKDNQVFLDAINSYPGRTILIDYGWTVLATLLFIALDRRELSSGYKQLYMLGTILAAPVAFPWYLKHREQEFKDRYVIDELEMDSKA